MCASIETLIIILNTIHCKKHGNGSITRWVYFPLAGTRLQFRLDMIIDEAKEGSFGRKNAKHKNRLEPGEVVHCQTGQ